MLLTFLGIHLAGVVCVHRIGGWRGTAGEVGVLGDLVLEHGFYGFRGEELSFCGWARAVVQQGGKDL